MRSAFLTVMLGASLALGQGLALAQYCKYDNLAAASATLYHSTATGTLLNDATSALWFANGVLNGAASGGSRTCAFVVDGAFQALGSDCAAPAP
jgi:hypothetical protein